MKTLNLTERQKNRLLKMCFTLFYSDNKHYIKNNNLYIWILSKGIEAEYKVRIHWFEFCLLYLINKINYPPEPLVNNRPVITPNDLFHFTSVHPVDYLYTHFLNIKKR